MLEQSSDPVKLAKILPAMDGSTTALLNRVTIVHQVCLADIGRSAAQLIGDCRNGQFRSVMSCDDVRSERVSIMHSHRLKADSVEKGLTQQQTIQNRWFDWHLERANSD